MGENAGRSEISVLICKGTALLGHVQCGGGILKVVGNSTVEVRL